MTEHSIWAGAAPPWEPTAHDDGDPSIRTAAAFYATTTTWYVAGAQLRAPASSGLGTVTLSLRITANGVLPDLSAAPVASAQVEVGAGAGWYEARWDDPVELTAPDAAWICLEAAAGDGYLFVSAATVGTDPIQATDASDLYLAEAPRAAFRIGSGSTLTAQNWYGLDLVVSDTPGSPPPSGGSVASITVATSGTGYARHAGGSAPSVAVSAVGQGRKRASGGSVATVNVSAVGTGFDPADVPDSLPVGGTLTPIITTRGLTALTPRRGLEIA